jgi:6-pyruvoyltetrahydropterin/6-carboxytetrahydropterin synthase
MYSIAVKSEFIAQHFLVGGDWGAENQIHSHHYVLELQLSGPTLDSHGYLVDIVTIKDHLGKLVSSYRDRVLNEMSEFKGLNPSLENLARISCNKLSQYLKDTGITALRVIVWEDEIAWAAYSDSEYPSLFTG